MSFLKKDEKAPVNTAPVDTSVGTAADVDAVMKKYDRESNVRVWEGTPRLVVKALMAAFSVYSIYVTLFSVALPEVRLSMFLASVLVMGYLNFPARKGHVKVNSMPWYDILIMVLGAGSFLYYAANAQKIIKLSLRASKEPLLLVVGVLGILALIELCRRSVGLPILCVVGALLVYTFTKVQWRLVIYNLFYTTTGVMNTPVNVCAKYIVVFIIFGAFLERTGIAQFFISLANAIAGSSAGGPAKVAVISSALCGMVSGSSVGNTVTTGSVTIPMMKKTGYAGEFAGAVEAAASTGGQIMPPIMGAAAFLMAEYMDVPYATVALTAILPAVLYFTGIYIAVHLEAKKLGLKGIPKDQLPKLGVLMKKIYLLAPLVVLVVMVSTNMKTMQFSAAIAILVTIIVGLVNNVTNALAAGREGKSFLGTLGASLVSRDSDADSISIYKIIDALEAGGKGTITVAVACAMAGIVAGCITVTGLASKLITAIVSVSAGHMMIALVLTMLCCIVLGMGVPTTANYCIMAATCAPILMNPAIGVVPMAAHFFVFYFGIVADITPPVALAAYAGSAIAKAPPMKTAINATKLAIAAFIVPYIFAMNPAMLLVNVSNPFQVVQIVISALIGLFGVAAALNGFLYRKINPLFRLLLIAGGLGMMVPGTLTDVMGLVIVGGIVLYQRMSAKRLAA
ncbi:TRAP transporter permease [Oscillibacter sp.]|uniref:TRAP transporter permease n=1 Tax=Oscillibacter sp. TaxID=1945593 RepID=UPI001B69521C|nr:TRAP transporter fused permease subunit [Oscillibacter sp.]MBP3509276.1 TRAP transporter fused permease subunit [Oscillibacter sp.]